ncbi:hypothetical protein BBH88_04885 [Planococcus antarcticus DSM 14505]|uniref:DUF1257 domain-containing protein n=1 Tax=Planococcus antarcticus DSM 14505 TaxID=1185653 RepID=A0ABM6D3P6_9BACL|nr:hypothetical protein [Planococcus antarcticus]ANU09678.1 hypothetical protein BBH88_04885 [Planococcus antarcticus DSM 14505]
MSIELILIPIGIAVVQSVGERIERSKGQEKTYKIKTVMKREHLLKQAIEQYGCEVKNLNQKNYLTEIGDIKIHFQLDGNGVFEAVFDNSVATKAALEFIENVNEEYKYAIQQETYRKLLQRAEQKGLDLESEEIQGDRSILLTFNVNSMRDGG